MAYRVPSFSFLHAARAAGIGSLTSSASFGSSTPLAHAIDNRISSMATWTGSPSDPWIKIDRGSGTLEPIDRVIIPAGHNLATATSWALRSSATGAFAGEGVLLANESPPSSGLIDASSSESEANRSLRYLQFRVFGTGNWSIGQLFITRKRTMATAGPAPQWTQRPIPILIQRILATREAHATLSPNRTGWSLQFNHLDSTDVAVLDDLFSAVGVGATPFYFDSMDDSDDPMWVRISSLAPTRRQDHPSPSGSATTRYEIQFEMIEQTS